MNDEPLPHKPTRGCVAEATERLATAIRALDEIAALFDYTPDCDDDCRHDAPEGLLTEVAAAQDALVQALVTCTAALTRSEAT